MGCPKPCALLGSPCRRKHATSIGLGFRTSRSDAGMPYCQFCGTEVSERVTFCTHCGQPTGSGTALPAVPQVGANAADMRPLSIGEILDVSIKLVTKHWKTLLR